MAAATKKAVMEFLGYSIAKGLVNSNTGGGLKAAATKILEDFQDDDDVAEIDVPAEVLRYHNRHPGQLSPDTLAQYQKRVITILSEFAKYQASPTTYKGMSRGPVASSVSTKPTSKKDNKKFVVKQLPQAESAAMPEPAPQQQRLTAATESSLMMPFPLRPNFLVQIIVPRDMTKDEASRLCTFITALGHDHAVVEQ